MEEPKQKAKELVDKFLPKQEGVLRKKIHIAQAKEYALIYVDGMLLEIQIQSEELLMSEHITCNIQKRRYDFWREVRTEIQTIK